ncbi:hypothetical protein [Kosakonia phage Kc283]|uniref:Uncharacterized protein n=1 Tax=Kosakonia phage Kc283 TaxID=2863195 RepID=A0AAE7WGL7_9CAUD|nr:hypothetical protein PP755_gp82 [Kosakonia phage Kc283]QYN79891.1 hypothetical protein [Kosakonia phage Kc283]
MTILTISLIWLVVSVAATWVAVRLVRTNQYED